MGNLQEEDEERRFAKQMGCMATLFHFFDRPHILSTPRRGRERDRDRDRDRLSSSQSQSQSQSQITESVSPSEPSDQSGPLVDPPSPRTTRASLSVSVYKTTTTWKLREAPRLSLDSRLRPRQIRTTVDHAQTPDDNDCSRRSPSVVARLMGVDALPTGSDLGPGSPAQLCRSASESRVPREPSYYRFIDPSVPSTCITREPRTNLSVRVSNPNPNPNPNLNPHPPFQRRSCFEPVDCYPEPKLSNGGEMALYGEIERRLRKRGIDEPRKDLETLKQILEALQLKGLLHSQPPDCPLDGRRSFSDDHVSKRQPPIVLMKPSSRPPRSPKNESAPCRDGEPCYRQSVVHPRRERRVEMDRMVRRSRSPDRNEMVKSPGSPTRRRAGGNAVSPRQLGQLPKSPQLPKRKPVAVAGRSGKVGREDDTSPSVSGSTLSALDFQRSKVEEENSKSGRHLLERCDKLLSSIAAFTSSDMGDSQPSPVSVLDASFLNDESSPSPSPSGKRLIIPPKRPIADMWHVDATLFDSDSDDRCTVASESDDLDYYLYHCGLSLRESNRHRDSSEVLKQRNVVYDAVKEIVEKSRQVSPWDAFTGQFGPGPETVKQHVWSELKKMREPTVNVALAEVVDLNDATCVAIEKDFAADGRWKNPSIEISDAVLQIERLVFKELVADTIKELADVDQHAFPRRKLVF